VAKVLLNKVEGKNLQTQQPLYYLAVASNGTIDTEKFVENVSKETGITKTQVKGVLEYIGAAMFDYMETGQSVAIPNLGTFQLNVRMDAVATEAELSAANIKSAHVSLNPSKDIRNRLANLTYSVKGGKASAAEADEETPSTPAGGGDEMQL